MSDKKKKHSPHYIPELDPEHPEWRPGVSVWVIRLAILSAVTLFGGAIYAWFAGEETLAIALGVIALIIAIIF